MLSPVIEYRISSDVHRSLTIIINLNGIWGENSKICKKFPKLPQLAACDDCHRTVFGLSSRPRNCVLLFYLPGYRRISQENKITSNRLSCKRTSSLIGITVCSKSHRTRIIEKYSLSRTRLQISNNSLSASQCSEGIGTPGTLAEAKAAKMVRIFFTVRAF